MNEEKGVWRTIRGRRVFIREGESLGSAMARSGKFKREDIRQAKASVSQIDNYNRTVKKSLKARQEAIKKMKNKEYRFEGNIASKNQAEKNRINENAEVQKFWQKRTLRNYDKYSETDKREIAHEELQKKLADYKAKKQSNNKTMGEQYEDYKRAKYGYKLFDDDKQSNNKFSQKEQLKKEIAHEVVKAEQNGNKAHAEAGKRELERLNKQSNNKVESEYELYKRAKEHPESIEPMTENSTDWEALDEEYGKIYALEKAQQRKSEFKKIVKQSNNDYTQDTAKERISYNTARDLLNQLNNEGSDFTFGEIEVDKYNKDFKEDGNIKTEVSVFMPDDRGYVSRELNIPIDKNETRASLEEKLRDWQERHNSPDTFYDDDFKDKAKKQETIKKAKQVKDKNDWLPKATEIKEQGTSNRKQVSDNIQAHILEYYSPDFTGDDSLSAEQAFVQQMDAMSWLPNNWKRGEEIAKGGSYLVYNQDMADFLDTLKINPKGKKFSEDKSFEMYTSLIGRESAKLYDKIKKHQAETINNYKKRKGK